MKKHPRIVLVHATRVAIDPIERAAKKLWPNAEMISLLEEGLAADRRNADHLTLNLWDRIIVLSKYAEAAGADGILFTCSAFGQAIEDAAEDCTVPVMKPNEAMFDVAISQGNRIAMMYTFPPAAISMEQEFYEAVSERGASATLTSCFVDGALAAKRAGDDATHDRLVADAAAKLVDPDVILLGQFSMAGAANEVLKRTNVPVLISPDTAIQEMRRRVEGAQKG